MLNIKLLCIFTVGFVAIAASLGCGKEAPANQQQVVATAVQSTPTAPPSARKNMLSDTPEYLMFWAPVLASPDPMSNEFLQIYSPRWVAKSKNIEAQVSQISDPELQKAQREKLLADLNPAQFRTEATRAYEAADKEYRQKRAAFFSAHSDQWVEIAKYFDFSTTDQTAQFSKAIKAPYNIELLTLHVDIPAIDRIFKKFRAELQSDIDSAASAKWQLILSRVNPNEFYAGYPQAEIDTLVAEEKKKTWDEAEQELRRSHLMLAVQGDIISKKFTRLAFLNQTTGTVLYEFPPEASKAVSSQLP